MIEAVEGKPNVVLMTGIVGAGGALLMAVCDLLLFAYPTSGPAFFLWEMGRGTMGMLPDWRLAVGSLAGAMVAPLQMVGFGQMFLAHRHGNKRMAWSCFLLLVYAMAVAGAAHGTFVFVGTLLKTFNVSTGADREALRAVLDRFYGFQVWLYLASGAALLGGSLVSAKLVRSGLSMYPKWAWWLTPFVFVAVATVLGAIAPAPVGGFLAPLQFNAGTSAFFIVSTWVLLREGRRQSRQGDVLTVASGQV